MLIAPKTPHVLHPPLLCHLHELSASSRFYAYFQDWFCGSGEDRNADVAAAGFTVRALPLRTTCTKNTVWFLEGA